MTLVLRKVDLAEANAFVARVHRHHDPVVGHKFSLGAFDGDRLAGVAIVGRPVARNLDDGTTLEVTRLATDGTRNACSFLYGAAARAAEALGFARILTYTLASEPGSSLRAVGWKRDLESGGGSWSRPSRQRERYERADLFGGLKRVPTEAKVRWSRGFPCNAADAREATADRPAP